MDNNLTLKVKQFARSIGADLVGIAKVERYSNAPIAMSPQGILPTAKSVIVCAIHHPDAAIELDGEVHPQVIGPYRVQYSMNSKLDHLSFSIARMLDKLGFQAVFRLSPSPAPTFGVTVATRSWMRISHPTSAIFTAVSAQVWVSWAGTAFALHLSTVQETVSSPSSPTQS